MQDIRTYLPDEINDKLRFKKKITMNHMMNHTAGFEDYYFDLLMPSPDQIGTLEEAIIKYQPNQVYEPGTIIAYSNYSTALAGYVIEQITGQSFSDYEMEHIFLPLLMNQTSGHPTLADHQQLEKSKAKGYIPNNEGDFTKGSVVLHTVVSSRFGKWNCGRLSKICNCSYAKGFTKQSPSLIIEIHLMKC